MSFTHLHVHSIHSLYHSTLLIDEAVDQAIRLGMNALAITDYDHLYAAHELVKYVRNHAPDFKPIIGCVMRVTPVNEATQMRFFNKAPQLTVLCKNESGYKNLCHLLDEAVTKQFRLFPTILFEDLEKYSEGLIILSGCAGCEIAKLFINGNPTAAEEIILKYRAVFGEDYYLELVRNGACEQIETAYTNFLLEMSKKHEIKVIATNDVHRCTQEDGPKVEKLMNANIGVWANMISLPLGDWLKSEAEMLDVFSDCPEAVSNTEEVVNKIEIFDVPQWTYPTTKFIFTSYEMHLDAIKKFLKS